MKKIIFSVLIAAALTCVALALSACGQPITAPIQLKVSDQNVLSWKKVDTASTYVVRIRSLADGKSEDFNVRDTRYPLASLEEGEYELSVKALPRDNSLNESDWSKVIKFTKEYENGCIYELINANREYQITRFGSASGEIMLKDEHHGKPVTKIADKAFRGCTKITGVTVGKYVTYIGDGAFMNCTNLEHIEIPSEGVTYLGPTAFQGCAKLKTIALPNTLTEIRKSTFAYCRGLTSITFGNAVNSIAESAFEACSAFETLTIPDSVTFVGDHAFSRCTELKTVNFGSGVVTLDSYAFSDDPNLINLVFSEENKLETIGESCFERCVNLERADLPQGLKTIETRAFIGAEKFADITIPDTVRKVGQYAFSGTKLYVDQDTEDNQTGGFIYADKWVINCISSLAAPRVFDEAGTTVVSQGLTDITYDTFKEGTVGIADRALALMYSLQRVFLNKSIKYVGKYSFAGCILLWNVNTPENGLEEIGEFAFANCYQLSTLKLGKGLKTIDNYAFFNCSVLRPNAVDASATIPSTVTRIGQDAFYGTGFFNADNYTDKTEVAAGKPIYAGNWVVGFMPSENPVNVELKNTTVGISDYAFNVFQSMISIKGLSNVRYIGKGAFWGCTGLGSVTLGSYVKEINDYTFSRCYSLFRVSLPEELEYIGNSAFYKCETLNALDLSTTQVKTIGARAFYGCVNLKTIDLNAIDSRDNLTLETIGERAFYGCISLGMDTNYESAEAKEQALIAGKEEFGEAFTLPENENAVVIPSSVRKIEERAFYGCTSLENLVIENGTEYIGVSAFANDRALREIVIPESVKILDKNAFYRCYEALVELSDGLTKIGDYCFEGVASSSIVIPESVKEIGKYAFRRSKVEQVLLPATVESVGTGVFYECSSATIYTDAEKPLSTWDARFNPSFRPVVYNAVFEKGGEGETDYYVAAVTIKEDGISVLSVDIKLSSPARKGYTLLGWATEENGAVVYSTEELPDIKDEITLYAVWGLK